MTRASVSLGSSAGERVTIALVILTLCVEVLSDNGCNPQPTAPITLEECREACGEVDVPRIRRLERYACECEPWAWEAEPLSASRLP